MAMVTSMATAMAVLKRSSTDSRRLIHTRIAALVGATLAGLAIWGSVVTTATAIWRDSNPERVLRLDPDSSVALASLAQYALAAGEFTDQRKRAVAVGQSRRAIVDQPLNAPALVLFASGTVAEIGARRAYPLFLTADAMTRRSAVTQFWLIEYEASADRAERVLFHYDAMLRVQPGTGEVLFPIMAAALDDRRLWPAFIRYFRSPPPWFEGFFRKAVATPSALVPLGRLVGGPGRLPDAPLYRSLASELLTGLAASNQFAETRRYFLALRGAQSGDLVATSFKDRDIDMSRSPFAWQPVVTGNLSAGFEDADGGNFTLRVSAGQRSAGEAARRMLMLAPGHYILNTRADVNSTSSEIGAYWTVECAGTNRVLGELNVIGRRALDGTGKFEVTSDCPAQNLRLIVDAGSLNGLDLVVRSVTASATQSSIGTN